jgi:hypothetical protein
MKLIDAQFEETEYRGPLFNQLQSSSLLWEPGQVFEKHIGIDQALWCTRTALFALHDIVGVPPGVVLSRYRWNYIWRHRRRKKPLPSFRLNLFVQAKRPKYGRFAPKALKAKGLKSPFWLFPLTPHQQVALEKLQINLGNRALVCYACPAFHKQSTLYKWTVEPRMIENSTFPDVQVLSGHTHGTFRCPGQSVWQIPNLQQLNSQH